MQERSRYQRRKLERRPYPVRRHPSRRRSHFAFTLVELVVSMGVLSLLIAVLLPALGGARLTARDLQCLVNAREQMAGVAAYATDSADHWPFPLVRSGQTDWDLIDGRSHLSIDYRTGYPWGEAFAATRLWHAAVAPYIGPSALSTVFLCPYDRGTPDEPGTPDYTHWQETGRVPPVDLSNSLYYDPRYLATDRETFRFERDFRVTRLSDVVFPSQKAVTIEHWLHVKGQPEGRRLDTDRGPEWRRTVSAGDGSVRRIDPLEAQPGVLVPVHADVPLIDDPRARAARALAFTRDGVFGRDW
jgi:type II secretory pathway pseudopilin PulG